jgi:hypothetical protein
MKNGPVFVECMKCGERWKVARIPLALSTLCELTKRVMCPNCFEKSKISMCPTHGARAVKRACVS